MLASDGFCLSEDNIDPLKEVGITALIQPGGSIADKKVVEACDTADIAMVFSGHYVPNEKGGQDLISERTFSHH